MHRLIITGVFLLIFFFTSAQKVDTSIANAFQRSIDSLRIENNIKGISACVYLPGKGYWKGVSGISYAGAPITDDMLFGIGSNSKLFTAVVILKLVEAKLLTLQDSLYKWLPTYPNIDSNITIRQLLNHTSGIADVNDVVGYPDSVLSNPTKQYKHEEVIRWVGPPLFKPGKGWSYCNTNYLLLALIAEKASGKSFKQLLHQHILFPLFIDSTFLDVDDTLKGVVAHCWLGNKDNYNIPRISLNSAAWSAGAMYSTAAEMAYWYHQLFNTNFLTESSRKEMTTFVGASKYGFGIAETNLNNRIVWQHGGNIWGGYSSSMVYDTTSHAVIAVLTNQNPAPALNISKQLLLDIAAMPVTTSVNEFVDQPDFLYPNPFRYYVVLTSLNAEIEKISFYNALGVVVKETTEHIIYTEDLPNGMYYVVGKTKVGNCYQKMIKL